MYDYDCCVMKDVGSGFDCDSNVVIREVLSDTEDGLLAENGFVLREISSTEIHVIANRLDTDALQRGTQEFWNTH